jgi:hypothetical protein
VTDFEQERVDVGEGTLTPKYPRVGIPAVATVGRRSPGVVRAMSVPSIDGVSRAYVTDLALGDTDAFVVRKAALADAPKLGSASAYRYGVSGNHVRLVGTGSYTIAPLRSILLEIGDLPDNGAPVPWRMLEDTTLEMAMPSYGSVVAMTNDLRLALVYKPDQNPSADAGYLQPLSAPGPTARVEGRPLALVEGEGTVSVLLDRRLVSFRRDGLQPLGELAFAGSSAAVAQNGDRVAVFFQVGGGTSEVRLILRCGTVPR